jgi:hypothetical protein
LGFFGLCGCSTDTFAKADGLAGNLALERPQDQLRFSRRSVPVRLRKIPRLVKNVEACKFQLSYLSMQVHDLPAQFTWLLGAGIDLYACHSSEAALARLQTSLIVRIFVIELCTGCCFLPNCADQ